MPKGLGIVMIVIAFTSLVTLFVCYMKGLLNNDDSDYSDCEV